MYVRNITAILSCYPVEIVAKVCDPRFGISTKIKWLPLPAEVKEACEDAMAPIYRERELRRFHDDRSRALEAPKQPKLSVEELRERYGESWGLSSAVDGRRVRWEPPSLDDLCAQAGISRTDFEASYVESRVTEQVRAKR